MRPVTLHQIGQIKDESIRDSLGEIERASQENDLVTIAKAFVITGAFTTTRTLNVATATLPDLIAFVATYVTDQQKGGAFRTV